MGDEFLVHFFLFFIIATALGHFRGIGIEEKVIIASDEFAYSFLDFSDGERIVQALR